MDQIKVKILVAVISICTVSCSPKFYTPNTQNTPMFQNKGELNATLAGNGNQVELQGAYAATNNIGVQINGGIFRPKEEDNGNGGSGNFGEVGIGYYLAISENITFETYGLLGLGNFENHLPSTLAANPESSGKLEANILRYGIQPGVNYQSDNFGIGLSTRIANLSYSKIKGGLIFDGENQALFLEENKSNLLVEPALTIRGGTQYLKLQLQIISSINTSNADFRQDDGTVTLGVNYTIK